MSNIDQNDLDQISQALAKASKPRLSNTSSLDKAAKSLNYSSYSKNPTKQKVSLEISSPEIDKTKNREPSSENFSATAQVDELAKNGEFSSEDVSFIPYGAGFINAKEVIIKLDEDSAQFEVLQSYYLNIQSIKLILTKIDKIYDLSDKQKQNLKNFYNKILDRKNKKYSQVEKATEILAKIKTRTFRNAISSEIQRMLPDSGDLYNYYLKFESVNPEVKKIFISRITSIDQYILKKIKELVNLTKTDLNYQYEEVIKFSNIISQRNILVKNFHSQVEFLAHQQKQVTQISSEIEGYIQKLSILAKQYGKNGQFGREIFNSSSLTSKVKTNYKRQINSQIEPVITKLQANLFDIETGDFTTLDIIKKYLESTDVSKIQKDCQQIFSKSQLQKI